MQTTKHDWPVGRADARKMLGRMALAALARGGSREGDSADTFFYAKVAAEGIRGGYDDRPQALGPAE